VIIANGGIIQHNRVISATNQFLGKLFARCPVNAYCIADEFRLVRTPLGIFDNKRALYRSFKFARYALSLAYILVCGQIKTLP